MRRHGTSPLGARIHTNLDAATGRQGLDGAAGRQLYSRKARCSSQQAMTGRSGERRDPQRAGALLRAGGRASRRSPPSRGAERASH